MGLSVQIEADYRTEVLWNDHPEGKPSGGNAIRTFVSGLIGFCDAQENPAHSSADDEWFARLEHYASAPICSVCRPLLDCLWSDSGDPTEYHDDEFEFFKKRRGGAPDWTEEQFKRWLWEAEACWQPIDQVIAGVQLLLDAFNSAEIEPLEGCYYPEYTIPDFEALLANLKFLAKRGHDAVRLNFN